MSIISRAMIAYTVSATCDDTATRDAWLAWLKDEHARDVLSVGALSACVISIDAAEGERPGGEARYMFEDRATLNAYLREHAPRLRALGVARFGERVSYARRTGEVVAQL